MMRCPVRVSAVVCSSAVALLLQMPTLGQEPVLHAAQVVLPPDSAPFQKLFDADGDGDPDAVGTRVRSDGLVEIRVWRNDGGTFHLAATMTWLVPTACCYQRPISARVATGDLDADGDVDFVLGAGDSTSTWTNVGTWQFQQTVATHPTLVRDVAIADVDADGDADLATLVCNQDAPWVVYLQVVTANGSFTTNDLYLPLDKGRIVPLQADGDAATELGVAGADRLSIVDLQGSGLVRTADLHDASIASTLGAMWTVGDIDHDGDADVVAFELIGWNGPQQPRVHTFRRTGTANWQLEPWYEGGPAEYLADIDQDGDLDGVCCGGGNGGSNPTWPSFSFASTFEVALNDGAGRFAAAFPFPGFGSQSLAGAQDIDGDGDVDLVAGACVFSGNGTWGRTPVPKVAGHGQVRVHPELVFDADGDGDPDVGAAVFGRARNLADGTFAATPPLAAPAGTFAFPGGFVGDFDGDGSVDEIAHLYSTAPPGAFVAMGLWRNNGSGVLTYAGQPVAAGTRMGLGWAPEQSDVADLDDDGALDLIGNSDPRHESRHSEIFRNDGTGFFTAGPTFAGERFEGAADLDGDGRTDLVTSVGAAGELRFRHGTGVASAPFAPPAALFGGTALGTASETVNLVDANADGRIDVLAVTGGGAMHLWENTTPAGGAASFALADPAQFVALDPTTTQLGAPIARVEVADVDGDDRPDLLVGPIGGATQIAVYRRLWNAPPSLAASSYAPPQSFAAPMGFARDADGDGDLDLIGTAVVDNRRTDEPRSGRRRQYGDGTAGEAGVVPVLGAVGPFVAGGWKRLQLTGVTGPTAALLVIGLQQATLPDFPLPGVTLLIDPSFLSLAWVPVTESSGGRAAASAEFAIYLPPAILGLTFFDQMLVLDAAAPSSVAASNGLLVRIGG